MSTFANTTSSATAASAASADGPGAAAASAAAPQFVPSPEQAAVLGAPTDADVLVVAGAGSGKTFTMTRRIIALTEHHVPPERILGLTFTRKAAAELLSRVCAAMPDGIFKPEVSTYDAFFQSIVRQYGLLVGFDRNTQPLSEAGALQLAADVVGRHMDLVSGRDMGSFSSLVGAVHGLSNAISGSMIGRECTTMEQAIARVRTWDRAFAARLDAAIGQETVPEAPLKLPTRPRGKKDIERRTEQWMRDSEPILHANCVFNVASLRDVARDRDVLLAMVEDYVQAKRKLNMAEFSDFTVAAYQLVTRFPSIGYEYRRRYSHVLLDEYQDTSTTQAMLLAAIFHADGRDRSAVSAVGDPFQSIYAWRGASPGAFRMFQRDFGLDPAERPRTLSVTRRNARIVLAAANNLTLPLRRMPRRPGSSLLREVDVPALSTLPGKEEGTLGVLGYQTLGQEIDGVTRFVRHERAAGRSVAVLFRSKLNMPLFRDAFEAAGLTTLVVGHSALLERAEVRDVLALLHVAGDHTDAKSLMRLLATPRYAMGAEDLAALAGMAEDLNVEYRFRALVQAGLAQADAPRKTWADAVAAHRDKVANAVFLPDLLMRADLPDLLRRAGTVSGPGADAAVRAGAALREVRRTVGRPLVQTVRAAVNALDLDIDAVVAQSIAHPDVPVRPALAHAPTDAVVGLVDTYVQEIAEGANASLSGFMTWVDALRDVPEESQGVPDVAADVTLMSIHQSKGLEWDAVAVVGLSRSTFPSGIGDGLTVTPDESHPGNLDADGRWTPPEYREKARTWLTNPADVPVPMRVDAGILPRFPRDAAPGADPVEALDALDDVEGIDDEVFGTIREVPEFNGDDPDGADHWALTQCEEYGRRLHADERRLAYVALTRARTDVLLTFSAGKSLSRDPSDGGAPAKPLDPEKTASNFWLEVHDSLHGMPGIVVPGRAAAETAPEAAAAAARSDDTAETAAVVPDPPAGYFVGDDAASLEEDVVETAWREPLPRRSAAETLPWPAEMSERVRRVLNDSADIVRRCIERDNVTPAEPGAAAEERIAGENTAEKNAAEDSLLLRARLLCADPDLMAELNEGRRTGRQTDADAFGPEGAARSFDDAVRERALHLSAGRRRNVTALQALDGHMSEREVREYWRGIVRPIPRVASPAAETGTRFHAWAERLLSRRMTPELVDLPQPEPESDVLGVWQRRLLDSPWARRTPAWAERQIVASIPELGGMIVDGKLDAVFYGPLDDSAHSGIDARNTDVHDNAITPTDAATARNPAPNDPPRYTIVDWKTGRRPRTQEDVAHRLAQLDLYRLLLARIEGVPIESIDAALYYVSEADPGRRLIPAERKSEADILDRLRRGIVPQSEPEDPEEPEELEEEASTDPEDPEEETPLPTPAPSTPAC
ncbi:UvrD/REP helicase [Bifidobacterium sp. DSM 109958]|uniref:DNA 3'-5' helicase n=1 Tax=Bifidobacterium moraviense TaxID=2675323 RepID=A0A7Y0F1X2_9BIFI|nr:ATP-dependent DNA helicase [Bifidobacterium sp. DSM 109958]NMN00525.1 UvrD/REP helicase [Bifidobacterium sp. DSM 109958]